MKKRNDTTIILIDSDAVLRADFASRGASLPRSVDSFRADAGMTIGRAVETTFAADNPLGRTAMIFSTQVWTQKVSLPRLSVTDLGNADLAQALKFETETLCGIDADLSMLAYQELERNSEEVSFWVTVIRIDEFHELSAILESNGVRQFFVAHPAGAQGFDSDSSHRIEYWRDFTCEFSGAGGKLTQVGHAISDQGELPVEFQIDKKTRFLVGLGLNRDFDPSSELADLNSSEDLSQWMASVRARLAGGGLNVPLLEKPRPNHDAKQRILAKALLALLAIVGCLLNWNWLNHRQNALDKSAEVLRQPSEEKKRYDSQISKIQKQAKSIRAQAEEIESESKRVQFLLQAQSDRLNRLMDYLRELHTDDVLIQEIISDEKGVSIVGISLTSDSATLLATNLRELILPMGWKANPAQQIGQKKMVNGGPWKFTIVLEDVGPMELKIGVAQSGLSSLESR